MILLCKNNEGWWVREYPHQPIPENCTMIVARESVVIDGYEDACKAGEHERLSLPTTVTLITKVNGRVVRNNVKLELSHLSDIIPHLPPCRVPEQWTPVFNEGAQMWCGGIKHGDRMDDVEWVLVAKQGSPLPLQDYLGDSCCFV